MPLNVRSAPVLGRSKLQQFNGIGVSRRLPDSHVSCARRTGPPKPQLCQSANSSIEDLAYLAVFWAPCGRIIHCGAGSCHSAKSVSSNTEEHETHTFGLDVEVWRSFAIGPPQQTQIRWYIRAEKFTSLFSTRNDP